MNDLSKFVCIMITFVQKERSGKWGWKKNSTEQNKTSSFRANFNIYELILLQKKMLKIHLTASFQFSLK